MTMFRAPGRKTSPTMLTLLTAPSTVWELSALKLVLLTSLLAVVNSLILMGLYIVTGIPWLTLSWLIILWNGILSLIELSFISMIMRSTKERKLRKMAGAGSGGSRGTLDTHSVSDITRFVAK